MTAPAKTAIFDGNEAAASVAYRLSEVVAVFAKTVIPKREKGCDPASGSPR